MKFYLFYKNKIQIIRLLSVSFFTALSFFILAEFILFLNSLNNQNFYPRPPGVDAYLPISSLMNLKYYIISGEVHTAHPYGLFFLVSAIFVSFVFSKSFCSWVCPFGFLSEILLNIRKIVLKKDFRIHKIADYILRVLKYIILGFFVYVIFFKMDFNSIKSFLDSDYNKISDIKMYYFFRNISSFGLKVIISLIILSFFFNFFWCRYLCPYGALMALSGFFSPFKIKRDKNLCVSCAKCTNACPHNIEVHRIKTVLSDDCTMCLMCVSNRTNDALSVKNIFTGKKLNIIYIPVFIFFVFLLSKIISMYLGLWQNNITEAEYIRIIENIEYLHHPRGF